ncbi:Ubiquitin carboxyl-terminal hydrolase 13 [Raphanus sativus]|nr:Ubiquitin carboxyl-terminal hydrolase 13 [Raphanus sativus]
MDDHPHEESSDLQEIRSPVKELPSDSETSAQDPSLDEVEEEILVLPHSDVVEGPLPMEGKVLEIPTLKFTWTIPRFGNLVLRKIYSDVFEAGGYKWRILIFPIGRNVKGCLSMYLEVADAQDLPSGWSIYSHFSLAVVNTPNRKYSIRRETQHEFNVKAKCRGFESFMNLNELHDHTCGYLVDDTIVVEVELW